MQTLTHVANDLTFLIKLLAGLGFVLGLMGSVLGALLHGRMPRLAALARVLAAWGPDVQAFVRRCSQARDTFRNPAAAEPGAEVPAERAESRVLSVLLDASNCQCVALLELYRQDCYEALFRTALTGDEAADDWAASVAFADVDVRWKPVWSAWRALRAAALGASSPGDHAADEQQLAAASRAIEGTLPPPMLLRFRALLARRGELDARASRLRDIDAELSIISSARALARRQRMMSGAASAP